jgi:hypothetical protein
MVSRIACVLAGNRPAWVAGYGFSGGDIEIPTDPVGLLL